MLQSGIDAADEVFHLVAFTITLWIVLQSSTGVLVARTFDERHEVPAWFAARVAAPDASPWPGMPQSASSRGGDA